MPPPLPVGTAQPEEAFYFFYYDESNIFKAVFNFSGAIVAT